MKRKREVEYKLEYPENGVLIPLTIHTEYLRDTESYPLGEKTNPEKLRDAEFVNRQPAVCNNFGYRQYKPDATRDAEIKIKYLTQQYTISNLNRTIDIFLTQSVSANFVIDTDGKIYAFVHPEYRSYALGKGNLSCPSALNPNIEEEFLRNNLNSYAITITNVNDGKSDFPELQLQSNINLMKALCVKYTDLMPHLVLGQNDWAAGRMTGPGPYFHYAWKMFAEAGFGIFPNSASAAETVLLSWTKADFVSGAWENVKKLKKHGYDIPQKDVDEQKMTDAVGKALLAFRIHFSGKEILDNTEQKDLWDNYVLLSKKQAEYKEGTLSPTTIVQEMLTTLPEKVQRDLLDPKVPVNQADAIGKVCQQYLKELAIFTARDAEKIDDILSQFAKIQTDTNVEEGGFVGSQTTAVMGE